MALIYSVVNAIIVSIVLMVIGSGRPLISGGGYLTGVISSYVIDLAPRPGLSAERLALFIQLLVAGEAIVTVWCVAVAAILPSRRIGAGLVAGFVIAVNAFLLVAELILGIYASLIKLITLVAVSALSLRNLGEFRMETVRYTLSLDRGLATSMDYYNRGRRYRERGMLAQAI